MKSQECVQPAPAIWVTRQLAAPDVKPGDYVHVDDGQWFVHTVHTHTRTERVSIGLYRIGQSRKLLVPATERVETSFLVPKETHPAFAGDARHGVR